MNDHVVKITTIEELKFHSKDFNTVDWTELDKMKYMRGHRMSPKIWHLGTVMVGSGEYTCLLYTSPSPRDVEESRMPSSA